jgi:hypothetical protein
MVGIRKKSRRRSQRQPGQDRLKTPSEILATIPNQENYLMV